MIKSITNSILKSALILTLITSILFTSCKNIKTIKNSIKELNKNWEFKQASKSEYLPAKVPGLVHLDLLKNNKIDEPYWANNEKKLQWIETKDWEYKTSFNITEDQLKSKEIKLVFKGLDTYADVYLNNKKILFANNMFRQWQRDIKSHLKKGKNELRIKFISPINHNKNKFKNAKYELPAGCETVDIKVSPYTRKAAYHFGWDWGPRFVSCGIWKTAFIKFINRAEITDIYCHTKSIKDNIAKIRAEISVYSPENSKNEAKISCFGKSKKHKLSKGENIIKFDIEIKNPELWQPNGSGSQKLYNIDVKITEDDEIIAEKKSKFGIRTIELVNEPDSIGTSFFFKVNGKPLFMKGANYIPQDMFLPAVKTEQYEKLIKNVKEAGMNMIRVWGGGVYEKDIFYDLCDKYGILIWQDFMFAGSLYPSDSSFINNVKEEVKQNIIRIRKHPCLALWCGNNEIEVAWGNWGWQKQYNYSEKDSVEIYDNYKRIFREIIPGLVKKYDKSTDYVPTSPLSNWGKTENFNHSSMHYWGVWHGDEPFENYNKYVGRFMVEYGFQSFPDMESNKKFASDSSLYLDSPVMQNRQKSYIGNSMITKHIKKYYGEAKDFSDFVDKSQKVQTKALKIAISAHLNKRPHCMGTLFWQLNDCWPGPSWSVIDYYGRKKKAYYEVKQLFKNRN